MKVRPGEQASGGFTLIELLVAIGVLGISMILILGVYNSVFSVVERVDQSTSFQTRSAMLVDQLQRDFFGIYKGRSGFFRGEILQDPSNETPFLEFTTSTQLRFKSSFTESSISVVRYHLSRPTNDSSYNLYRSEMPLLYVGSNSAQSGPRTVLVCERVNRVSLSFKDRYGEVLDQWQARSSVLKDGPDDDRFPSLVRLEVVLADGAAAKEKRKKIDISIDIPDYDLGARKISAEEKDDSSPPQ